MVLRYIVPPVAGASFSLALYYLYQEALLARHTGIKASLESSAWGLDDVKRGIEARMHRSSAETGSHDDHPGVKEATWKQNKNHTLGEEMQLRWNHQLVALTNGIANLRWDSLADDAITGAKSLFGSASSVVADAGREAVSAVKSSDLTGTGNQGASTSSNSTLASGGDSGFGGLGGGISGVKGIVDTRGVNLRSPEERKMKVAEEVEQAASAPLLSKREPSLR
ncbi:unnamed protein product [Parajaminaea phylloscopi]